jgi:type II secretory pathway pseudopilin PulG
MNRLVETRPTQRAFTLIELLIATTVTLLLILAITQAFAVVGQTVTNSRATLEMAGQLRTLSQLIQRDLQGATSPAVPWVQSSMGLGYIEILDGPGNDLDADADLNPDADELDPAPPLLPLDRSQGDVDDVIMCTVRNDDDPFRGQVGGTEQRSNLAEVVMWMGLSDQNQNGLPDPEDMFATLYRRTLLIRPDLNGAGGVVPGIGGFIARFPPNAANTYSISSQTDLQQMRADLLTFYNENDISVRFQRQEVGNQVRLFAVANNLGDLAWRQNRFCHDPILYQTVLNGPYTYIPDTSLPAHFPFPLNVAQTQYPTITVPSFYYGVLSLSNMVKSGLYLGHDVALANVRAFDVKFYDPLAPVVIHRGVDGEWGGKGVDDDGDGTTDGIDIGEAGWAGSDDECLVPGDLGFEANPSNVGKGFGAYVDLNYKNKYAIVATYGTFFEGPPASKSRLVSGRSGVYDTWPLDYEYDGFDEDNDSPTQIDEGGDGIDSDGVVASVGTARGNYGVDDPDERETSPPYAVPLVGLQITIRMIDPDTRQVRQVTVTEDFFNE